MKKTIKLTDLDCANCAAKIETAVSKFDEVIDVKVNFMRQTMTLETADDAFDTVLEKAKAAAKKIEPGIKFTA